MARAVEPVRCDEVRLAQPEPTGLLVHPGDEPRHRPVGGRVRERRRGVVRARDQRRLDELAHRDPLARSERNSGLADPRCEPRHRHDVVELEVLECDEDRHQLGDARDRARLGSGMLREDRPVDAALHEVRLRRDRRRRRRGGGERGNRTREQEKYRGAKHRYQPAATQISAASLAASRPAAARQSSAASRKA